MEQRSKWYAIYTKPRWEKKVHKDLVDRGIESYCPLNRVRKQWSDRVKVVEEPLFKSYVFVRIPEEEGTRVRMVNGVLNFVYWNGKPAIVKDKEIADIRRFLNEYEDISLEQLDLKPEDKVVIRTGVMMDKEAVVRRVLHNRVEVVIESLGYKLVASMDRSNLERNHKP
jgi:transcription antitermination factor NusG